MYDLNTLPTFKRTQDEITNKYYNAMTSGKAYVNYDSNSYYSVKASSRKPYHQGVLKQDTVTVMQEMTNFYRYLVGVQPLKVKCVPSPYLQYQALDRCFVISHFVTDADKPSDMSKALWDKGSALNHNILAWGYSPSDAITGWMNEGYTSYDNSWDTFGHRYALISERLSEIQFGYCDGTGIGDCVAYDNDKLKDTAYAFPCPGYMPNDIISSGSSGWTIDFDADKVRVDNEKDVTVTITNLRTKKTFTRTVAKNTLIAYDDELMFAQPDDCEDYTYTDNYKVDITGLKTPEGKSAEVVYTVKFYKMRMDISKAKVSGIKNRHYTGKALKQSLRVKVGNYTLCEGYDYKLSYKNNKEIGTATVTITGIGSYKGKLTKTFKICSPKTTLKKVTSPAKGQIKSYYTKVTGAEAYQTTYSTSSKFTKATTKSKSSKNASKTISGLTSGKTYYVKVRSYKEINGVRYYSAYSEVKKVKVKQE